MRVCVVEDVMDVVDGLWVVLLHAHAQHGLRHVGEEGK